MKSLPYRAVLMGLLWEWECHKYSVIDFVVPRLAVQEITLIIDKDTAIGL